ncbi:MAG: ABC transporter ATP-binding protein, partial [Candidatus Izemoplasmatales bacterium]|nr:ABC transporter ATP-binding protein [Candidatus Izemoplasmatales bacterium]
MIKLVNVSKFYNSNDVIALGLRRVNLELNVNEFVAVVGESGSGKTTLLNVVTGIDTYEDGEMYVNGEETSYYSVSDMENYRKKYVAFVFQDYNLIDSYTVLQNVEAPLLLSGYPKEKIRERALELIRKVGLEDHIKHKATKLSGGQKQRVVIARALAKDCPIIAADEPTGNLDSESAKQIIKLLADISKDKLVIMVTHDFSQVEHHATRKIRIYDGEIVEDKEIIKT